MSSLDLDALAIKKMASGNLCLNLTERVGWEAFPKFAESILRTLGGEIMVKSEGVSIRVWQVRIGACVLLLVFDDYPVMVSLESSDPSGDLLIEDIYRKLLPKNRSHE